MTKILLDTNVLVYSKDADSIFYAETQKLLAQDHEFYITSKNLVEYYCVVTKGNSAITTPAIAQKDIEEFQKVFNILYPSKESFQILLKWIETYALKGLKAHDFEIAAIAKASGVHIIATANTKDFPKEVTILSV